MRKIDDNNRETGGAYDDFNEEVKNLLVDAASGRLKVQLKYVKSLTGTVNVASVDANNRTVSFGVEDGTPENKIPLHVDPATNRLIIEP